MAVLLSDVYADACELFGRMPTDVQMEAWTSVLAGYQPDEVKRALMAWLANDEINKFTGRTYGSMMPAPSELKAIAVRARREEQAKLRSGFQYCGNCVNGLVLVLQPGLDGRQEQAFNICHCVSDLSRQQRAAGAGRATQHGC
jgi:hypothetical protein